MREISFYKSICYKSCRLGCGDRKGNYDQKLYDVIHLVDYQESDIS